MVKKIIIFLFFCISVKVSNAQLLEIGGYSGVSHYSPRGGKLLTTINRWENDIYLRWQPKGKLTYEAGYTYFKRSNYEEGQELADNGYSIYFPFYERDKGIYRDNQLTLRTQYHIFHSADNRFNFYAGITAMVYFEASEAYTWYYNYPDSTKLLNSTHYNYKGSNVWGGINAKFSYTIHQHFIISALLQGQEAIQVIKYIYEANPLTYEGYGDLMLTAEIGLGYSFSLKKKVL